MDPDGRKDVLIRLQIDDPKSPRIGDGVIESGKPILDYKTIDILEAIHTIKWHAEAIDKIYDQTAPTGDDALSIIVREPIGVVALCRLEFPAAAAGVENWPCIGGGCS